MRRHLSRARLCAPGLFLTAMLVVSPVFAAPSADIAAAIAERLRGGPDAGHDEFARALAEKGFLDALYVIGAYAPLWSAPGEAARFVEMIRRVSEDGLVAGDYHLPALNARLAQADRSATALAELDILLTDAFVRLAYHLRFGKASPRDLDPNWNFSRSLVTADPALWLYQAISERRVAAALEWLRPHTPSYHALKSELRRYREIAAAGGWPLLPAGPTLKPGQESEAVAVLRARLAADGMDAEAPSAGSHYYDGGLERAVRAFQRRHGLHDDGLAGTRTREALNVGVEARIAQLRVNLERIRWVFRDIEEEFVAVNIAAFHAAFLRHGEIVWSARAVVGQRYRQTPIFKAAMTHVIFNPTWTVPPTILRKDVLPAMRKDPGYLQRRGLSVVDRRGAVVDPGTIDWNVASARGFPYLLRQAPGPANVLGRVKFMFPNPHLVYLHDTPAIDLFDRAERTFSSGCIRIERPLELAALLLESNKTGWSRADMDEALAGTRPRRFDLDRPVTVMLLYLTAFAGEDGTVQFRRDVYDRDAAVLRALDGVFRFVPPAGYRQPANGA